MNSTSKWILAIGTSLSLGLAAAAVQADTDHKGGRGEQMHSGAQHGKQDGKSHARHEAGEHRQSAEGQGEHKGMREGRGRHRQMANAQGDQRRGEHRNEQRGSRSGERHGQGEHKH